MTAAAEDGARAPNVAWRWSVAAIGAASGQAAPYCRVGPPRQPFPSSKNRERGGMTVGTVLCGVDHSDGAMQALRVAPDLCARSRGLPLPRSWSCRRLQTPGWAARTLLLGQPRRVRETRQRSLSSVPSRRLANRDGTRARRQTPIHRGSCPGAANSFFRLSCRWRWPPTWR
jgi:hypothetical protein